jgi:hypothetical protein
MFRTICVSMALALIVLSCSTALGEYKTVGKDYSSTDVILESETENRYYITADDDKEIKYSAKVVGNGTIKVLLAQGHGSPANYYVYYSENDDTRSYSDEFPVGSDDGEEFVLGIRSSENYSVTYKITIEVRDQTYEEMWLCGGICLGILVLVGIGDFYRRKKRKEREEAYVRAAGPPMFPQPYPQQPYQQPPPQPYPQQPQQPYPQEPQPPYQQQPPQQQQYQQPPQQ